MCKCCLWCLEKFVRFLNKNAYIMCAMKVKEQIKEKPLQNQTKTTFKKTSVKRIMNQ